MKLKHALLRNLAAPSLFLLLPAAQLFAGPAVAPGAAISSRPGTAATRPPEELYDLEEDPHELKNLASSAGHGDTLKRMRGALESWIEKTREQGAVPEPPEVLEYCQKRQRAKHEK